MAKEEKTVDNNVADNQQPEGDLTDVLNDFNSQSGDGSNTEEFTEETTEQTQERQEAVQYLIDNKFQDTPGGRQELAKAYTELQSKTDKDKAQFQRKSDHYTRLDKLDGYLKENPDAVKMLQSRIQDEKKKLQGPPDKPDDYDILDEGVESSSSSEWREKYNAWLINEGRTAAKAEVDAFKNDLKQQDLARRDDNELSDLGLSSDDKAHFRQFLQDPANLNNKTLVQIWKFLNGDGAVIPNGKNGAAKNKNLQTSAAAVSGNTPATITPQSAELDEFWDGIMSTTNRVSGSK